jgi:predicted lipoprotein with Yx(FWY)xxD motif
MRTMLGLSAAVLAALLAASSAPASPAHAKVQLRATELGRVLVDARGHTLYLFGADRARKSACYGQCASLWPPLVTRSAPLAGAGVKRGLLTTTKRKDGSMQVVYRGHPLYFFAADTRAGQVKGEGINHFGGRWWALNASGLAVHPKAAATPPPTTPTPPGGGYGGGYGP